MADNGVVIRTPVKDISLISRHTQGVKLMKLKDKNNIVSVAMADHEVEEDSVSAEEMVVAQIKNETQNEQN